MGTTKIDRTESLRAYPTISAAARMIGVAASTLTRRDDLEPLHRGSRDQVLPPAEVMRLAAIYRKRSLNEVAASLVDHATAHDADDITRVEDEIDRYFENADADGSVADFLQLARKHLSSDLYAVVEKATLAGEGRRPKPIVGHEPGAPQVKRPVSPKSRPKKGRSSSSKSASTPAAPGRR